MEAAFAKVDFRKQRFSLMWNFENRAFTEGQGGKTASAPPHSQVVKRRQVYFCEIRPAKTHSVPTSLGGAAMFCALFLGGPQNMAGISLPQRDPPDSMGSHCRSEIPPAGLPCLTPLNGALTPLNGACISAGLRQCSVLLFWGSTEHGRDRQDAAAL